MVEMDRATGIFVGGLGAAAATSGILSQLQGRIFAVLYLRAAPLALEDIAAVLGQSKSNVSVNIRGLVDWHLVRRAPTPGSRKDHYEAASGFWRVMQEIMERRFRWTVRQVLATIADTEHAAAEAGGRGEPAAFVTGRLAALRAFFQAIDAGFGAFTQGKPLDPASLATVVPLAAARPRQRK
jgi:DNA-binding transcriptional regulator GbsR (MarR family)